MGTNIRTSVAKTNPYYIRKHEYLFAKHFALQYNDWRRERNEIESRISYGFKMNGYKSEVVLNPVEKAVEDLERYSAGIELIERSAKISGEEIWEHLLLGVTNEYSYEYLRLVHGIPCCKDVYYKMYRKFFFVLNHELRQRIFGTLQNYNPYNGTTITFKEGLYESDDK